MRHAGNERGALQITLLIALLILGSAGLSTWGVLRHWRKITELQLRLDRCTGEAALALKSLMQDLMTGNSRISALRQSIQAARGFPPSLPPLVAALGLEVANQERIRAGWEIRKAAWLGGVSCKGKGDLPQPLPALRWFREPPDSLGPRPLSWAGPMPEEFRIELGHSPRHSAAVVTRKGILNVTSQWQARWTAPRGLLGPGSH